MALSGSSYDAFAKHRLVVEWSASQNISGNYSDVTAKVYLQSMDAYSGLNAPATNSGTLSINGTNHSFSANSTLSGNQKKLLYAVTQRVGHGSDGKKSFAITATYNVNVTYSGTSYGNRTTSGNYTLNNIPRAYAFNQNQTTYEFDSNVTVNIISNGSGFRADLRLLFGNKNVLLKSNCPIGSNFTVAPNGSEFASQITNASSGQGTLSLETFNGSTKIGTTNHGSITFKLPDTAEYKPSITNVTFTEQNTNVKDLMGSSTLFVQSKSKIRFDVSTTTSYSSDIATYKYEANGKTFGNIGHLYDIDLTGNDIGIGEVPIKVSVTDGRGRTATTTTTISIQGYAPPTLTNFSLNRVNNGTTLMLTKTAKVSSLVNAEEEKNTYKVLTKYKKSSDTAWITAKEETNESVNFNLTDFAIDSSYDLTVTLTDKFTSTTVQGSVSTAIVLLDMYKDVGIGIGKMYEEGHGSLDVAGSLWTDEIILNGSSLLNVFYPIGSIYESTQSANPSTFMGGMWERFGNGKVLVGVDEGDADFNTVNKTGGAKTVTLTTAQIPSHSHGQRVTANSGGNGIRMDYVKDQTGLSSYAQGINTDATGGGGSHNNLQPFVTVYRFRRTA